MNIQSIEISNIFSSGFETDMEGIEHHKTLPCLSLVQSLRGSYDIGLDGGDMYATGEMGVFVAPSKCLQRIRHHNGSQGTMKSQWVFMNVTVNTFYRLEDLYEFPLLLPQHMQDTVAGFISTIRFSKGLCAKYAAAYQLLEQLLQVSAPLAQPDRTMLRLQEYVMEHFRQPIHVQELADYLHCSIPQVYRLFQKYFSQSPANYINRIRLQNAALMLENSTESITDIAVLSGFDDIAYFSKLFREVFCVPPTVYRRQNAPSAAERPNQNPPKPNASTDYQVGPGTDQPL